MVDEESIKDLQLSIWNDGLYERTCIWITMLRATNSVNLTVRDERFAETFLALGFEGCLNE